MGQEVILDYQAHLDQLDLKVAQVFKVCKEEKDPQDNLGKLVLQAVASLMEIFVVFVKLFLKITSLNLSKI